MKIRHPVVLNFVIFLCVLTSSCAHGVRIISVPEGAEISVDDQKLGQAPVLYEERSSYPGRKYQLKAELSGKQAIIKKEKVRICSTPANILLDIVLIGFAFGFCLEDEYTFDFVTAQK